MRKRISARKKLVRTNNVPYTLFDLKNLSHLADMWIGTGKICLWQYLSVVSRTRMHCNLMMSNPIIYILLKLIFIIL